VLGFWPSDGVLLVTQASLVCGPRPALPPALARWRSATWAWLLLPLSLGGTIAVLALLPGLSVVYAWVAAVGVPVLAAVALGSWFPARSRATAAIAVLLAGCLLALAWVDHGALLGQAAAVALTALSCCSIASYLAGLAPSLVLRLALVAMAVLDAVLVFGRLLEKPNDTLNAAGAGGHLPHLQVAVFGSALVGYGDLCVAAVLGNVIAAAAYPPWPPRWAVALLVLACSALFDLLFLAVDTLPATVPVAAALGLVEVRRHGQRHRAACDNRNDYQS
jgi:hypothetical protein